MNAKERRHMNDVAALGCIVCDDPAAECHHPRTFAGAGQRAPHFLVIPLCHEHHRGGFSIHQTPREFQNIYGSEAHLLAKTIERMQQ